MPRHGRSSWLLAAVLAGSLPAAADTLVLRSGKRVEGELIAVRGDTIEFAERRSFGPAGSQRYDRREVSRIELDQDRRREDARDRGDDGRDRRDDGGAARGLRERVVNVASNVAWTDTGVEVRRGQELRFSASGRVRWGPDRRDGPGGEGGSHTNPNRPIPNRPGAGLIGRIGQGSDYFFIGGDQGSLRARDSGRLYLGVNDDFLQDNSGSFRVTVYY